MSDEAIGRRLTRMQPSVDERNASEATASTGPVVDRRGDHNIVTSQTDGAN